jgi:hypothetical protein
MHLSPYGDGKGVIRNRRNVRSPPTHSARRATRSPHTDALSAYIRLRGLCQAFSTSWLIFAHEHKLVLEIDTEHDAMRKGVDGLSYGGTLVSLRCLASSRRRLTIA